MSSRWPHAPSHVVTSPGAYIVTAATYSKPPLFRGADRLTMLEDKLLEVCEELGWRPQQWAVFPNHYHLVALSPEGSGSTAALCKRVHGATAFLVNKLDDERGRPVWHDRWESRIDRSTAYVARLNYVRTNAVRHGLVSEPEEWRWCSAAWFALRAPRPLFETVCSFKTDLVQVPDDF